MKKINFITNLSLSEKSGGGSGVNFATYHQLQRYFGVNYIGPISIAADRVQHIVSKLMRIAGLKGNYFFFSDSRLKKISAAVETSTAKSDADYNFFHGFTSWIRYRSRLPYFCYADACFATYVRIYNDAASFRPQSLNRIYQLEKEWLSNAAIVFFRSQWALEETKNAYNMKGENFRVAGLGGFIDIPPSDVYAEGKNIIFISREFVPKGGYDCFNAFKILHKQFPELTLTIIGETPPAEVTDHPGVKYVGLLNKNNPAEYATFKELVSQAFVLVHPTIKDTNALVLTEVGYYGCPSIATRLFAIPQLIQHGKTGFLVDVPVKAENIAEKISYLLKNQQEYKDMRKAVRDFTTSRFTWDKVGNYFQEAIAEVGK